MPARINFSQEDTLSIIKLYEDGTNSNQIAAQYNVSASKILTVLKQEGVNIRLPNNISTKFTCSAENCERVAKARGLCDKHYQRLKKHGDTETTLRNVDGTKECSIENCHRRYWGAGYCLSHYDRVRRTGDPRSSIPIGPRKRVEPTVIKAGNGYLKISFLDGTYKSHHRYIMEQHIGRELMPEEVVHHKNGNRSDNRVENLELWSTFHPSGQRINDLRLWAKELLEKYPEDVQ